MAGIRDELPALMALIAPSVPSYLRLQPGHWSGAFTAWGIENREAALRFVPGTVTSRSRSANVELKVVDGAANPYYALAACLHAGRAGIERNATLPEPTQEDPGVLDIETLVARGIRRLPVDLGEAAEAFAASAALREGLGATMHDVIAGVRRKEWAGPRREIGGGAGRAPPVRVLTRFAANVSLLFRELPFLERFGAAAAAGLDTVEFHWPRDEDLDAVAKAVGRGRRRRLPDELRRRRPRRGRARPDGPAGAAAPSGARTCRSPSTGPEQIGCPGCTRWSASSGRERGGRSWTRPRTSCGSRPTRPRPRARPCSSRRSTPRTTVPSCCRRTRTWPRSSTGWRIQRRGLQFDAYHAAMLGRDPVTELERHFARVGHVQIADCPGRGERGTGAMDVDGFLAALDRLGYDGHVGLEYRPSAGDTLLSLAAWGV